MKFENSYTFLHFILTSISALFKFKCKIKRYRAILNKPPCVCDQAFGTLNYPIIGRMNRKFVSSVNICIASVASAIGINTPGALLPYKHLPVHDSGLWFSWLFSDLACDWEFHARIIESMRAGCILYVFVHYIYVLYTRHYTQRCLPKVQVLGWMTRSVVFSLDLFH